MGGSSFWLLDKSLGVVFSHVNHSLSGAQEWGQTFEFEKQTPGKAAEGKAHTTFLFHFEHRKEEATPWGFEGILFWLLFS